MDKGYSELLGIAASGVVSLMMELLGRFNGVDAIVRRATRQAFGGLVNPSACTGRLGMNQPMDARHSCLYIFLLVLLSMMLFVVNQPSIFGHPIKLDATSWTSDDM